MVSQAQADWLAAVGAQHVAIIAENTEFGIDQAASNEEFLTQQGITSDVFFIELSAVDFAPVLLEIRGGEQTPDAVIVEVTGETSFALEQRMAELDIAPTADTICFANQVAVQPQFWEEVPDGNYCAFRFVGLPPALANDLTRSVTDRYTDQFNTEAPRWMLESYDSLWLLADAIDRADSSDSQAIVTALEGADIELTQGRYFFEYTSENPLPDDGSVPDYLWHQWPNPTVLILQYFEPEQNSLDAAVVWPPIYQTHDTNLIEFGGTP